MTSAQSLLNVTSKITSSLQNTETKNHSNYDFYIGLSLAILSSFFIGSSFILKKKGLIKLSKQDSPDQKKGLRASDGGHGYLYDWLWWTGFLTMGLGELCNFTAYGFVPATLVTPLGALSVLVSAVMAAYFLNEKLNTIGKIGCALTAIGSTVMVIHAPKEGEIRTLRELLYKLIDIEFVIFVVLSIISLIFLIYVLVPKYGNTNVLIYILICSILGSYTVMSCKGISLGIKEIVNGNPTVPYSYTSFFVVTAVSCIVIQINYLNKSLDVFNTAIVTTVYYVLFSLFVMIASALLFKELMNVSFQDFVGCMCGFSTIICALCLIHFFKSDEDAKNFTNAFNLEKFDKNRNDPILVSPSNHSDVESHTSMTEAVNNDNGLFENLTKKNINVSEKNTEVYGSPKTQNEKLHFPKENNFSFVNYLSNNYKQLESKYINRFNKGNSSFTNYNYNKLQSNEMNDEQSHQMNSEESTFPSRVSKNITSNEPTNSKNKKNNRYFSPFDDDNSEIGKNLLPTKNFVKGDQDETVPLNV